MARYYIVKSDSATPGNSFVQSSTVDWTYDNGSTYSGLLGFSPSKDFVVTAGSGGVSYQTFNGTAWSGWSTASPANFPTRIRSIEYCQGGFLFVGDGNGQCHRTTDGATWSAAPCTGSIGSNNRMIADPFDRNYVVAVVKNSTTLKYSLDGGVSWSNPTTAINYATHGNIVTVAFALNQGVFHVTTYVPGTQTYYNHVSTTGASWAVNGTTTGIAGATATTNLEITKAKTNNIAIGWIPGSASAYISTNNSFLDQWTSITLPIAPAYVSWNGTTFNVFPAAATNSFYTSTTGAGGSWSEVTTGNTFPVGDYGYVSETIVNDLDISVSSVLTQTQLRNRDINLEIAASIVDQNIGQYSISCDTTVLVEERDFISGKNIQFNVPTTVTTSNNRFWGNPWSMIYAENKWVGVKNNTNTGATSTDGATWTAQTLPSVAHWNSITHDGTTFITIAEDSNKAATRTLPNQRDWHAVTTGNATVVAVALESDYCAVSSDSGATWTEYALPVSANWTGIAWSGTTFCAVTDSDVAATSTDGQTWTQRTMPSNIHYNAITYGLGKFMAVASGPTDKAATSADGVIWTEITLPQSADWTTVGLGIGDPNV